MTQIRIRPPSKFQNHDWKNETQPTPDRRIFQINESTHYRAASLFETATFHGTQPQRDRAGASVGSDQTSSSAQRESPILPRASLRAQDRSRRAPAQTHAQAHKTLQTQDQPPKSKHPKAKPATLHGTQRQRDRAEASIGSDQTSPSAQRESSILPRASLRAQDRSRGAPAQKHTEKHSHQMPEPDHPRITKRGPFCVNMRDPASLVEAATFHGTQPQRDRAGASIGSDQTSSSAQRESPILPRASLRAQDRSRRAPAQEHAKKHSHQMPEPDHPRITKSGPFCVNMRD